MRIVVVLMLCALASNAEETPPKTLDALHHLHSGGSSVDNSGSASRLGVSKGAYLDQRACSRMQASKHLTWSWQNMYEGFYSSADVNAVFC
ncbi:hypothetical protein JKP88DRAFT_222798 [Tribonema minus]|uniref:Uncharacterized protein n=1 Tax=Tribonema minus TaxID=303371 RepID=A0A836CCQ4_9STRA|nr:hypothetical protein JKP88DRAFT_222798 [Tribonema minus]